MQEAIFRIDKAVAKIASLQITMEKQMSQMDDAVAALGTQVAENTSAEASAVTLLQQLATLIHNNASDPAKVTALAASLKNSADALAAAITANTPA